MKNLEHGQWKKHFFVSLDNLCVQLVVAKNDFFPITHSTHFFEMCLFIFVLEWFSLVVLSLLFYSSYAFLVGYPFITLTIGKISIIANFNKEKSAAFSFKNLLRKHFLLNPYHDLLFFHCIHTTWNYDEFTCHRLTHGWKTICQIWMVFDNRRFSFLSQFSSKQKNWSILCVVEFIETRDKIAIPAKIIALKKSIFFAVAVECLQRNSLQTK